MSIACCSKCIVCLQFRESITILRCDICVECWSYRIRISSVLMENLDGYNLNECSFKSNESVLS